MKAWGGGCGVEEYEQGSSAIQINSVGENGHGAKENTPVRARGCRQIAAGSVQELPGVLPTPPRPPHPVAEAQGGRGGAARRQQRSRGNFAHGARSPRCWPWAGGREAAAAPPTAETLDGVLTAPGSSRCLLKILLAGCYFLASAFVF